MVDIGGLDSRYWRIHTEAREEESYGKRGDADGEELGRRKDYRD